MKAPDRQLYFRLLQFVKPYWQVFALAILAMIVLALSNPALAALLKYIIAGVFLSEDKDFILLVIAALLGIYTVAGVASYTSGLALNWVANKAIMDIRISMFTKLLAFPSQYYDQHTTGSLVARFSFDVTRIKEAATSVILVLIKDTMIIGGLLAWMFYINWMMTAVALLTAPIIMLALLIIRKRLRVMSRKVQESMGEIHHVLDEVINGQRIVKSYGGEKQEAQRFQGLINAHRHFNMKFASASLASSPVVQMVAALALAITIYIAAQQSAAGTLGVDDFISFVAAVAMLFSPLKRLVGINEHLQKGLAACESVFGLLDAAVEVDTGVQNLGRARGQIEIQGLSYQYHQDNKTVLKEINLELHAGETVALVGASGSGKTTLANLIPRFYTYKQGQILLDGIDIRDIALASLRGNIALVGQDIVLFNDSIRNNIAYGDKADASEAEVIAAARAAHALEFIEPLPSGLHTLIGAKGLRLSGGQRQRIALARALLKDAPILILDEATSALDTESERHIQQALKTIMQNRSCIIIAHRLSTIESADRIIVLKAGEIVETGTHRELLKSQGAYARLYTDKAL